MHCIDVHHHLFPPPFVAQLREHEHYLARGVASHWTPQTSLDDMDAAGIASAINSCTDLASKFGATSSMNGDVPMSITGAKSFTGS